MTVERLLATRNFRKALEAEFYAPQIVAWAIEDLIAQLPQSKNAWERVVEDSAASASAQSWLVILPNSHPIAAFYPVLVGLEAGLTLYVRQTTARKASACNQFLNWAARTYGTRLQLLPTSFRLGQDSLPPSIAAVFAFSSDATAEAIKPFLNKPLAHFGDSVAACLVAATDIQAEPRAMAELVVRDALALAQAGCMSARCLIVVGALPQSLFADFTALVRHLGLGVLDGYLDPIVEVGLDQDLPLWLARGASIPPRLAYAEPLVPELKSAPLQQQVLLSERRFVLPSICYAGSVLECLRDLQEAPYKFRHYSLSPSLLKATHRGEQNLGYRLAALGQLNRPDWDGLHEGRPLFALPSPGPI